MAIIRISREQIEEAYKAREAALREDANFRAQAERLQRLGRVVATAREEQRRRLELSPNARGDEDQRV